MTKKKTKATTEDALEILYAFLLNKDPPQMPLHYDKRLLKKELRDKSFTVSPGLTKEIEELCKERNKSEEFQKVYNSAETTAFEEQYF